MAPGADAVGFIDGHTHQLPLLVDVCQQLAGGLHLQALGCQIDQPQPVAAHPGDQIAAAGRIEPPVQTGRRNAAALQVLHLIFHQGHQRRNHQHQAATHQRWQLITERFASARGQHRQAVAPLEHRLHYRPLAGAEACPTEMLLQRLLQRIRHQPGLSRPGPSRGSRGPRVDPGPPPPAAVAPAYRLPAPPTTPAAYCR